MKSKFEKKPPNKVNRKTLLPFIERVKRQSTENYNELTERQKLIKAQHEYLEDIYKNAELLVKSKSWSAGEKNQADELISEALETIETIDEIQQGITIEEESIKIEELENKIVCSQGLSNPNFNRRFFDTYYRYKDKLGLRTQEDMAQLTGLDRRYISKIERSEHRPQYKTLKRFADAFGIDVSELI